MPSPRAKLAQLRPVFSALVLGAAGGAAFAWLQVPLAWLLGPLVFNVCAQALGVRVAVPQRLRAASHVVLGTVLGASFDRGLLAHIDEWPLSLAGLALFTVTITAACAVFYRARGLDTKTALFSAAPGVMSGMIAMGSETGGDERRIALIQSMRVAVLVLVLPPLVVLGSGATPPAPVPMSGVAFGADLLVLAAAAIAGAFLAVRLRLPAPQVLGATAASAAMHIGGWVSTALPPHLLAATLLVLGAGIGTRFAGVGLGEVLRTAVQTLLVVAVLLVGSLAGALVYHHWLGFEFWAVLLAFAPGGVAEMSAIALALGVDSAFVAFHHLFRIMLIIVLIPVALSALERRAP